MDYSFLEKILKSNILLFCVVLILVLKIITVSFSFDFPQNIFFADITKLALENFVNQTRHSAGLPTLTENKKLDAAAQLKAENMVANNYFNHTSPAGISPWHWFLQAGYNYKYAGENLAIGFFDSQEVFNAWLNSPSHKANILNPNYKEVGTAVLPGFGQNNAIVVVQEFGSQKTPLENSLNINNQKVNVEQQASSGEKVLAQSIAPETATSNSTKKKYNNYNNYSAVLQYVIYGFSLFFAGIFITLAFTHKFKKELVFRSLLVVILLLSALIINKDLVILIIPHQITI